MRINANTFCIRSNDNKTITTNKKQGFKQTFFSFLNRRYDLSSRQKTIYNHNFFCKYEERNL